jgi:hypothetical protein
MSNISDTQNVTFTGSAGNAAASATGSAVPSSADYIGFSSGGNLVGVSSSNPLPITGSISATNPSVSATGAAAPTSATLLGIISGANIVGVSSTNPVPMSQGAATTGGTSTSVQQAITTSAQVKSSAGQIYGYRITNTNTSTVYVFWYNTTSAPTIGSTTNLIDQMGIPAGASANDTFSCGIACSSGIYVAVSTSPTGSAAPSTGLTVSTLYF